MKAKNITLKVSQDSNLDFTSIASALTAAMQYEGSRVTIQIGNGIYKERLIISQNNLILCGESANETIITFGDYALSIMENGEKRGTFRTPTVFIDANDFTAHNITFQNSAGSGPKTGQALAVYVDGERILLENCRLLGGQDTLFTAPLPPVEHEKYGFRGPKEFAPRLCGQHYYKNCFISGDVDFIFGGATAYFEGCEIFSRNIQKEVNGYITAASTPEGQSFGYVFNQCQFTSDCPQESVYLGRPWRDFAKVVILNSVLGAHIKAEGWHDWGKKEAQDTVYFAEYNNTGKGALTDRRVPWSKLLTSEEAEKYTKENVLSSFREKL
ncbi:MAG: pectinesterase family protein [Mobilitalea sp.]